MSRNQPENLIRIFIFILGTVLILFIFMFLVFSVFLPSFNNVQPSRESGYKSLPKNSAIDDISSSQPEIKNYQKNQASESSSQQNESGSSASYSTSSTSSILSSSSSSYTVKNDRGNYQDQIGAYDPIK